MQKLFFILICFIWSTCSLAHVVLIDPGHGGDELGAIGKLWKKSKKHKKLVNVYEKDFTLDLAKKIKKKLEKKYTVFLTRSFDRTLSLENRSEMSQMVKADIFVSIHFNSAADASSNGFETFYLDNHDDVAVKKVEQIENKALYGSDKIVNQILIDLVIQKTVNFSKKLATSIHKEVSSRVSKKFSMKDRGIKPGLFFVLALSKRPAVLVEAGFMSNSKEMQKMNSSNFLNTYANAVAKGIDNYLKTLPAKDVNLF